MFFEFAYVLIAGAAKVHQWRSMMTLVTEDQFDIEENSVVHRPTNARFSACLGGQKVTW
jgi:hypothetical protein